MPSPGASAIGRFATSPIIAQAIKEEIAVAVKTAPESIPLELRIEGLTIRIYAIVIKVVSPAMVSFLGVVLFSFSLKILLSVIMATDVNICTKVVKMLAFYNIRARKKRIQRCILFSTLVTRARASYD